MEADPYERYDVANRYPREYARLMGLAEQMAATLAPMAVDRGGIRPNDPSAPLGPILGDGRRQGS
jgi:hypothetical protein